MVDKKQLLQEIYFKTARSGGPGGQNVNKVATKVVLYWDLANSQLFDADQKQLLITKLATKIDQEEVLQMASSKTRSQLKNKEDVIEKFIKILEKALQKNPQRIATKIPISVKSKRLDDKKKVSKLKKNRITKNNTNTE